jgi:hypothetical protein
MFCLTATSTPLQIRFERASVKVIWGGVCLGEALPLGLQTRRCVGPFLKREAMAGENAPDIATG